MKLKELMYIIREYQLVKICQYNNFNIVYEGVIESIPKTLYKEEVFDVACNGESNYLLISLC